MRPAISPAKAISSIFIVILAICALGAFGEGLTVDTASAQTMARFDFEQKYFVHPGRQTWDFSLIRPDDTYHLFYHTAIVNEFGRSGADTIWHATSPDLAHWNIEGPIIAAGQGAWDTTMTWAPDVFRDDANNRWGIAYTAVDTNFNQRISFAFSPDLYTWTRADFNPTIIPDSTEYIWSESNEWQNFRDPYVYRQDNQWHILVAASKRYSTNTGVLFHGVSDDLETWVDVGVFFKNDGTTPSLVLESPQYHQLGDYHHLLFGEYDTAGTTALVAQDPDSLSMANRVWLDYGYAPEVDSFDAGVHLFSRLAVYRNPVNELLHYVIRTDTLAVSPTGDQISVVLANPMDAAWEVHSGSAALASPTFGDNPTFRGEPAVGVVGNGYFGSAEYHQGPLSGRGSPGVQLGNTATGELRSYPFAIQGDVIDLLVGGGYYPSTCYVALMDATADTIIFSATGNDDAVMSARQWSLAGLLGRQVYIKILDIEYGDMGFINVDEIIESGTLSAVIDTPTGNLAVLNHSAYPNPFNPMTRIQFSLATAQDVSVEIYDMRGRQIWRSGPVIGHSGLNSVSWRGIDTNGQPVATGGYLYAIKTPNGRPTTGKLTLVK